MAAKTHALVIGVSRYDELPKPGDPEQEDTFRLRQLESAALSAAAFARWVDKEYRQPDAKVASVRLLLSPSPKEKPKLTAAEKQAKPATAANVADALKAWRQDLESDPANVGIFYGSGHGAIVSPLEGGILLLQDFAADRNALLENALNVPRVHAALSKGPAKQFYFLDACQIRPALLGTRDLRGAGLPTWDADFGEEREASPIYFSASSDSAAWGDPGKGTLFSEALLDCLRLHAQTSTTDDHWIVNDSTLGGVLRERVAAVAKARGKRQQAIPGGNVGNVPFHVPTKPPEVEVTVSVTPDDAVRLARCTLTRKEGPKVFSNRKAPVKKVVPAGFYTLDVAIKPPTPGFCTKSGVPMFFAPNFHPKAPSVTA